MENPKPSDESGRIEKQRSVFFVEWMTKLAAAFGQPVSDERIAIYAEALMDLADDAMEAAFRHVLQTCRFFPTVADIRGAVEQQHRRMDQFNAELAWCRFKELYDHHWHPDVGLYPDAPCLDEPGEYAMRIIGGFARFAQTQVEHEAFIRKEFIDAYQRYRETGAYLGPTREEAARLLDELKGLSGVTKELIGPRKDLRRVLHGMTPEEFEARLRELEEQKRRLLDAERAKESESKGDS